MQFLTKNRLVQPSLIDPGKRKRILAFLRNMQVYSAEYIVQRYRVKLGGQWVEGRQRPGHVVLTPTDDTLNIYLKRHYLPNTNPYELVEQLAQLTGIHERKDGRYFLNAIFSEQNLDTISIVFDHFGIPSKFDDDEDVDNSWLQNQRQQPINPGVSHHRTESLRVITAQGISNMFGNNAGYASEDDQRGTTMAGESGGLGRNPWQGRSGFRIVTGLNEHNNRPCAPTALPEVDENLESRGQLYVRILLCGSFFQQASVRFLTF